MLTALFEADVVGDDDLGPRYAAVAVTGSLLGDAARLSATHARRALDAVQLASALAARRADDGCTSFACFDQRLRAAATTVRFALHPATVPSRGAGG